MEHSNKDRQPVVSGAFYSGNKLELYNHLKSFFDNSVDKKTDINLKALIVPHAGYVYSGEVAANGFSKIDPKVSYENIFIIASSHRAYFKGASIYNQGNYITPLGLVKVNQEVANELIDNNTVFSYMQDAHLQEHSIEVQLPFLQYIFNEDFQIIPIVLGTQSVDQIKEIAKLLQPFFNKNNLFIISSDFSHYPSYDDAVKVDHETLDAILTNSPSEFIKTLDRNEKKNISNLATSACGWTSILTLLNLTQNSENYLYKHIMYKNSGEYLSKNTSRVVGYHAIIVTSKSNKTSDKTLKKQELKKENFSISVENQQKLLKIARETIDYYLKTGNVKEVNTKEFSDELKTQNGSFVTLHKKGDLRGCIGRFTTNDPLYQTVQNMAVSAAINDYRFERVTQDEMSDIDIEISVLSPLKKIESVDEIELGKHGIYIIYGHNKGTFLPQVATETGWTKEEFLGHCARDKARIGWDGWKNADIYIYEAFVFGEKHLKE